MTNLRKKLIRLAAENHEIREAVLPLLAADKTAATPGDLADVGDGQEFANLLSKKWRDVKYDAKRRTGTANIGGLKIAFQESGSDTAVIVTIKEHPYMKGEPKHMVAALNKIKTAMHNL